ncbi:MAG: phenylalanine--tRNA ligase subunit beta [Eubacteriales bacterium]
MNLSRNWLKEFVSITADDHSFSEAMTLSGTKVEATHRPMAEIHNVVVGKVISLKEHGNSDHMMICQVDVGNGKTLQIVTGAPNVKEGALVPVALPDSVIAGGKEIKSGELRGEKSDGMLCSLGELGLDLRDFPYAEENGLWLIEEEDAVVGTDIRLITGLEDSIVEFEITPNRVDCYSILGLAREVAATYDVPFPEPTPTVKATCKDDLMALLDVEVEDDKEEFHICPRYTARMVRNVKIAPSPRWMRERLRSCNVRPINNIVDITNYVMLEYGQPMHAFDYRYVGGNKIIVRGSRPGETVTTLDGVVRTPPTGSLVIADENKALGLAGIMGGENSGISEDTVDIVFESATFHSKSIRDCANALGMRTDASALFEKGLNPLNTLPALDRACELVELLGAGDVVEGVIDCLQEVSNPLYVPLVPAKINRLLGTDLSGAQMLGYLERLGFQLTEQTEDEAQMGQHSETDSTKLENGEYFVRVPWWRTDLEWYIDYASTSAQMKEKKSPDAEGKVLLCNLPPFAHYAHIAEEVARLYGYDNIPTSLSGGGTTQGGFSPEETLEREVGGIARALGHSEIITYSFISPSDLDKIRLGKEDSKRQCMKILNPLGEDTSIMRSTLLPSMLEILVRNYNYRNPEGRFYELGKIYSQKEDGLAHEPKILSLGGYGNMDFFTIKGTVETLLGELHIPNVRFLADKENPSYHSGRCAKVFSGETFLGTLGQVHPLVARNYGVEAELYCGELSLAPLFAEIQKVGTPLYSPLPKFPSMTRDIALLCDVSCTVGDLAQCIEKTGSEILREVALFDVYQGKGIPEGKKSLAFNLLLRSDNASLTGEEADKEIATILSALEKEHSAVLR